jgi:hypothetical protein
MTGQPEVEKSTVVTDEEVPARLANIIRSADKRIVLVSPYVDDWKRLYDWLPTAVDEGKKVILLVRRDTDRSGAFTYGGSKGDEVLGRLAEAGVEIRWTDNLHSKVYLNEQEVFVTSMNLLSSSAANSKEIGLSLTQGANVDAVREYVERLINLSEPYAAAVKRTQKTTSAKTTPTRPSRPRAKSPEPKKSNGGLGGFLKDLVFGVPGFCIRCGEGLTESEVESGKVLCTKDYGSWVKFKNPDFKEKFCTTCGEKKATMFARPQCRECYAESPL